MRSYDGLKIWRSKSRSLRASILGFMVHEISIPCTGFIDIHWSRMTVFSASPSFLFASDRKSSILALPKELSS